MCVGGGGVKVRGGQELPFYIEGEGVGGGVEHLARSPSGICKQGANLEKTWVTDQSYKLSYKDFIISQAKIISRSLIIHPQPPICYYL